MRDTTNAPESVSGRTRILADFDNPPVVETSMGFFFAPIEKWNLRDYWSLWERFRDRYPNPEFKTPIGEMQFKLDQNADLGQFPLRAWYVDSSKCQLLQVQNNCFLRNWRKTSESPFYRHYEECRPTFVEDWRIFAEFLLSNSLRRPHISRCEMTYFNHLVRGEDFRDFSELPMIFRGWKGVGNSQFLSKPQMINISAAYTLAGQGVVHLNSQGAVRQSDGKEIIQLSVTATGIPEQQGDKELFECLDSCHEAAVLGFLDFTGEEMHGKWRRTR